MDEQDLSSQDDFSKTVAALVRRLIDAGTPPDVAAVVVTEAVSTGIRRNPQDKRDLLAADRRRHWDRKRKQKSRLKLVHSNSGGQESKVLTLTKSNIIDINKSKSISRKHRIPPDWKPSEKHYESAASLGIPRSSVDAKAEDMRIWAGSSGATKVDWDLTFHGFIRRDASKLASEAARTGLTPRTADQTKHQGIFVARDSPAFAAWDRYANKKHPVNRDGGWYFPTEWPPKPNQERLL